MFKNKLVMEKKKDDKVYLFQWDQPGTLTELIEVLCEFRNECAEQLVKQLKEEKQPLPQEKCSPCEDACKENE